MVVAKSPYSFEQVWFLDCYGHVISYNNYWKELVRVPLQGLLVSGYTLTPYPFSTKFHLKFWDIFGEVVELPQITLQKFQDGLVSFYCEEKQNYVAIDPSTNKTTWSGQVNDWEKFLPLTRDMFEGLLVLTDPYMGEITTEDGLKIEDLYFVHSQEQKIFTAGFGRKRISVRENLDAFSRIGQLREGESVTLTFVGFMPGRRYKLTITRIRMIDS